MENVSKYNELLMTYVIAFGSKVLGAIALWVIGGVGYYACRRTHV